MDCYIDKNIYITYTHVLDNKTKLNKIQQSVHGITMWEKLKKKLAENMYSMLPFLISAYIYIYVIYTYNIYIMYYNIFMHQSASVWKHIQ